MRYKVCIAQAITQAHKQQSVNNMQNFYFNVYANFNTNISTHIAQQTNATLLAQYNSFDDAMQYADDASSTHAHVTVVANDEGEAYYSVS